MEGLCWNCFKEAGNYVCPVCHATYCDEQANNNGGTCFECIQCHRCCSCLNESEEPNVCVDCYETYVREHQHGEIGGNRFKCLICGRECHCTNESNYDRICVECYSAAQRLGRANNPWSIVKCPICSNYGTRADYSIQGDVCDTCYNELNQLTANETLCLSATALTEDAIDDMKDHGIHVVARYLNNEHVCSRYFGTDPNNPAESVPYINEYMDKVETDLARNKNVFLASVFHFWSKNTNLPVSANVDYETFLAIRLAHNIHQPSGTRIYFEIPDRLIEDGEYVFINNYIAGLKNNFGSTHEYNLGIIGPAAMYTHLSDSLLSDVSCLKKESNGWHISSDRAGKTKVTMALTGDNINLGIWFPKEYFTYSNTHKHLSAVTSPPEVLHGFDNAGGLTESYYNANYNIAPIEQGENWKDNFVIFGGYLNHKDGTARLTKDMLRKTSINGQNADRFMKFFSIFQNAKTSMKSYFTKKQGEYDAMTACWLAEDLGQPDGKPIYFAVDETVDNDPTSHEYIGYPETYFTAIHSIMQTLHYNPHHYSIGLYGPGLLAEALRAAPFNYDIHLMLPGATSYAGYNTEAWNIKQKWIDPGYDLDKTSETRDSGVW